MRKLTVAIAMLASVAGAATAASAAPAIPFGGGEPAFVTPVYMDGYERAEREEIHRRNMIHQENRYYRHERNQEHAWNRYQQYRRNVARQYYRSY